MKLRHQVGLNIQKLRRERGISQEDLALMAKVNRGYMGKLENAKNSASLDMVECRAVLAACRRRAFPVCTTLR